ncbi:MAG: ABC transporter substrate-binding protein [Candidatus Altiarchaeota archaeon]
MKITHIILLAIIAVIISGCISNPSDNKVIQEETPLKIGIATSPFPALLFVAKEKGFFEEEGLNVEFVEFTAGKFALQAFLAGSLDLTVSGEVPVMYSTLSGNDFYVITQLVERTKNEVRIVARKDGDLNEPQAYFQAKKRKLATSFGGGPEFYTHEFLEKYNITDIELVNQKPEDMPAALASGTVDAVAVFDPFAYFAEQKLDGDAVVFKDGDLYSEMFVLTAHKDWVRAHPEETEKILRSLLKASQFIEQNPEESKNIVMPYSKLDRDTLDVIWSNFVFKPVLNDLLPEYLEAEAEWAKETGKVSADTVVPDFREYIYTDSLKRVKPEYVTI